MCSQSSCRSPRRPPRTRTTSRQHFQRWVGLEVDGDGLRVGAVPVRGGVGPCDGVVGRGLDEARRFRVEGRLRVAAGMGKAPKMWLSFMADVRAVMPYMRPVTRFPYGLSLEARHLAALKGVRQRLDDREGREGAEV